MYGPSLIGFEADLTIDEQEFDSGDYPGLARSCKFVPISHYVTKNSDSIEKIVSKMSKALKKLGLEPPPPSPFSQWKTDIVDANKNRCVCLVVCCFLILCSFYRYYFTEDDHLYPARGFYAGTVLVIPLSVVRKIVALVKKKEEEKAWLEQAEKEKKEKEKQEKEKQKQDKEGVRSSSLGGKFLLLVIMHGFHGFYLLSKLLLWPTVPTVLYVSAVL